MKMEYVFLFVTRKRDKNPYNPAKEPIAIFRENDFPICYFSMCGVIGESRNVDNPT
jgi:hypothetical protein